MFRSLRALRIALPMLCVTAAATSACVSSDSVDEEATPDMLSSLRPTERFSAPDMGVFEPATLRELETKGFALHQRLGAPGGALRTLASVEPYRTISQDLAEEALAAAKRYNVPPMSYPFVDSGDGRRGRAFHPAWFQASEARFELVGVVNRMDKYDAATASCGETRLIYRMAYTHGAVQSRVPMSINLVYANTPEQHSCSALARAWTSMRSSSNARSYLKGPLRQLGAPQRLEINVQIYRSGAGDAGPESTGRFEYLLRAYDVTPSRPVALGLENTPRTNLAPAEQQQLRSYLRTHADEVETGRVRLPENLLAKQATVQAPFGLELEANRSFSRHLGRTGDLLGGDLHLGSSRLARTPTAWVRRADTLACNGCHAQRAVGAFHVPGRDEAAAPGNLALEMPVSNHFREMIPARRAALAALSAATDSIPATPAIPPFAEHGLETPGGPGAHCGLAGGDSGFAAWTCSTGLSCRPTNSDDVGACSHGDPKNAEFGDSCTTHTFVPPVALPPVNAAHSIWDVFDQACSQGLYRTSGDGTRLVCDEYLDPNEQDPEAYLPQEHVRLRNPLGLQCNTAGWPNGSIQQRILDVRRGNASLSQAPATYTYPPAMLKLAAQVEKAGVWGSQTAIEMLIGNNIDFLQSPGGWTSAIAAEDASLLLVGRCDAQTPCRDDYACGQVPGAPQGNGACLPPYFVPSLQLFGHDFQ